MQDNKIIKAIYTLFLGVLIALFVGVGIATFYPGPKAPEYPHSSYSYEAEPTPQQDAEQKAYEAKMKDHDEKSQDYHRNVSMIVLVASVFLLIASISAQNKLKELSDGVMLGGLFTLLYSIILGFASQNNKLTFLLITVGLALVMHQGYVRLNKPTTKNKKK